MDNSPTTGKLMQKSLRKLRREQYAALTEQPIDWDKIDRLGQTILKLEILRSQSTQDPTTEPLRVVRSAA